MRRDRVERIATAERDRRAGRLEIAAAAIGEPAEWPARVVLALVHLSGDEPEKAHRLLEEGLDSWASEMGLGALDPVSAGRVDEPEAAKEAPLDAHLDRPFDSFELDRAFAEAQTQTEEMRNVNHVAERVLMDEPVGLAELSDEPLMPIEALETDGPSLEEEMDAAFVAGEAELAGAPFGGVASASTIPPGPAAEPIGPSVDAGRPSHAVVLATLERWLENLERLRAGRVQ
ncbi:MAG TPA: hypothetical protein ENI85_11380 [Deltaproteobacteria bacterium]|nr:hypothetical protein [Deltaproteobacteria bacterium]